MARYAFRLLLALAAFAALAGGALLHASLTGSGQTHLQKEDCGACHLGGRDVTPQQAGKLLASQEALCGKCHPAAIKVSHPSGFTPKNRLPDAYPADWKGDLTCSTCHEVHGKSPGLMRGSKAGKELCLACHDTMFFRKMRDGGASLMVGHLAGSKSVSAAAMDVYTRQCMECHSNNGDPRLNTKVDSNSIVRHAGGQMNHPVGVDYQKASTFGGYRQRKTVEKKLLLPGGLVSCVSCHHGYQKDHGKLVVTVEHSRLCYECHDI